MLLFLSLSTADQRIWLLPRFCHGEVNRTGDVRRCVGGKAVNAARAACLLGGRCTVVGFFSGDLAALLTAEGLEVEARRFSEMADTQDMREGLSAFLEKRRPTFKDR